LTSTIKGKRHGRRLQLLISRWDKVIDTDGKVSDLTPIPGHVEKAHCFLIDFLDRVDWDVEVAPGMPPGEVGEDEGDMDTLG